MNFWFVISIILFVLLILNMVLVGMNAVVAKNALDGWENSNAYIKHMHETMQMKEALENWNKEESQ